MLGSIFHVNLGGEDKVIGSEMLLVHIFMLRRIHNLLQCPYYSYIVSFQKLNLKPFRVNLY